MIRRAVRARRSWFDESAVSRAELLGRFCDHRRMWARAVRAWLARCLRSVRERGGVLVGWFV